MDVAGEGYEIDEGRIACANTSALGSKKLARPAAVLGLMTATSKDGSAAAGMGFGGTCANGMFGSSASATNDSISLV
jgi:hypothetical protein